MSKGQWQTDDDVRAMQQALATLASLSAAVATLQEQVAQFAQRLVAIEKRVPPL